MPKIYGQFASSIKFFMLLRPAGQDPDMHYLNLIFRNSSKKNCNVLHKPEFGINLAIFWPGKLVPLSFIIGLHQKQLQDAEILLLINTINLHYNSSLVQNAVTNSRSKVSITADEFGAIVNWTCISLMEKRFHAPNSINRLYYGCILSRKAQTFNSTHKTTT